MRRVLHASILATSLVTACFLTGDSTFQADDPIVYVAKVKNLLTGLAPTDAEIQQVSTASDPSSALASLIDQWSTTPEYTNKMMLFFELAFQQSQITTDDFAELIPFGQQGLGSVGVNNDLLVQNVKESFARTVLELIAEGKPFTEAFTTPRFMMTPALMELYGYLDAAQPADDDAFNTTTDQFRTEHPGVPIIVEDATPIAFTDTIDEASTSFMQWYYPALVPVAKAAPVSGGPSGNPECYVDTRTYQISTGYSSSVNLTHVIHDLLYGSIDTYILKPNQPPNCVAVGTIKESIFQPADFQNWKMVTLHAPNDGSGAQAVRFYDVPTLRTTQDLVLSTPRIGFFSTPAFHANWQTNTSNEMRVTINQTLIIALGAQVDGTDTTQVDTTQAPGFDATHAAQAQCAGCHQTLDPTRAILQATYSYGYGKQSDPTLMKMPVWFAFQGVTNKNITSISDFAQQLASHPLVAQAWAQKLCYYANSQACATDDPAFQKIVADFQSGFSWQTLVRELFSSPLVTNASETKTYDELGETVSLSRSDHLCATLSARLNLGDVCGLESPSAPLPDAGVPLIAAGLPSDGYGRGATIPVLPTQPTLFYRAGTENICEDVANQIIDAPSPPAGAVTFSSTDSNDAITNFVGNLMGLDASDPRASQIQALLQAHYTSALASGQSATDSLKSTFIVACTSPSIVGIGM